MLTPEQQATRQSGIGGSDAPAIAGVDPYRQPLELYLIKRGEQSEPDLSANEAVHFGNRLEALIAEEFSERTGLAVRRDNRTLQHRDLGWMLGHIDRRVQGKPEGLEIKNRSARMAMYYGPSGSDEVHEPDLIQCMHYLTVTGWELWHLAVYFGGGDFRIYQIPRDDALIDDLCALESAFWKCVQTGTPPAIDFDHPRTDTLLDRLYPGTNGETVTLPDAALHWHGVLQDAADHRKRYEAAEKAAKAHLRALLGDAAIGVLPGGQGAYTRKQVERKGHTVEPSSYIDFRYTTRTKGANA